jgi:DNA-binding response OmpR family regulator
MSRFQTGDECKVLIVIGRYDDLDCYEHLLRANVSGLGGTRGSSFQVQVKKCISSEVLAICQQEVYACILLDWELADRNGKDLLHQLDREQIAIVLLVGEAAQGILENLDDDRDYLIKETLTKELFCSAVRNAISKNQLKQKLAAAETKLQKYKLSESQHLEILPKY